MSESPVIAPQIASRRPVPIFRRIRPLAEAETEEQSASTVAMNPP